MGVCQKSSTRRCRRFCGGVCDSQADGWRQHYNFKRVNPHDRRQDGSRAGDPDDVSGEELRISSDVYDPVRYGTVYAFYISGVLICLVWKCCRSYVDECVPDYLYSGILHGKEDGTH